MKKLLSYILFALLYLNLNTVNSVAQPAEAFTVLVSNNPAAGYLMLGPFSLSTISMIDNSGIPVHVASLDVARGGIANFNVWPNGLATFWNKDMMSSGEAFYAINNKYQIVDTFQVTNAYQTDFHDFQWLSNGHYVMLGEEFRTIDMSQIVPNGNPTARVRGFVIQEFDANHNLLWQWSTFDHFSVTDATSDIDLTLSTINYCHVNSFFIDTDGNLVISSRHLDEVTKINKTTGEIIWRMGGSACKNNQFTFTNDTHNNFNGFSHQHDIQRLPNGHLLMFDNGNLKPNQYSRAVEYDVNEVTKTVTKVWEYRHNPDIISEAQGSVQKLPNGNTLISWASNSMNITCTEIDATGNTVFEMSMPLLASYRVYRQVFKMAAVTMYVGSLSDYNFNGMNNNTQISLNVTSLTGNGNVQLEAHSYPAHNQNFKSNAPLEVLPSRWVMTSKTISKIAGKMYFDLDSITNTQTPDLLAVYYRVKEGSGTFERLTTAYNVTTRKLEAAFNGFGEYIIGMPGLDPPVQDSPSNNGTDVSIPVSLIWKKLTNATSYRLQISTNQYFNTNVLDSAGIKDSSLVVSKDLLSEFTKYYWRVNAEKNNQTTSWSDDWTFTTELLPPDITIPADSSINIPINGNISWDKELQADSYCLQLSEFNDFSNYIINTTVKTTDYDYKILKFNKQYFWRINSKNGTVASKFSGIKTFWTKLDSVTLNLPKDNFNGINPKSCLFSWLALDGADVYHIQISRDSNFTILERDISAITDTFYIENHLGYDELYYWRVSGSYKLSYGEWSVARKVITSVGPPSLIQPNNKSRNMTISGLLKWENTLSAVSYHLQMATDSQFVNIIQDKDHYKGFTFPFQNLAYDTKYYWRVLTYTNIGSSNWSSIWEFQTRQEFYIDKPILQTPSNEQYNMPISGVVIWEPTPSTISYRAQVSFDNSFDSPIIDTDGLVKNELDYGLLNYNREYYWRVMANGERSKSEWSETGKFYTKLESPSLLFPGDKSEKIKVNATLRWNPINGASVYFLQFSKDDGFYQRIDKTMNNNSLTKIDWLSGFTTYFWRVKGINGKKESEWSDVWSFTTDDLSSIEEYTMIDNFFGTFPNPFSDHLIVSLNADFQKDVQISVINEQGLILNSIVLQKTDKRNSLIYLNTDDWENGAYLIKMTYKDEFKIVKAIRIGK